ncbi:MAG TPA: pitrilysin family protein [Blastocatellia bacterium]|nr:pitrilysin family protein [Blastocatellia bacterium]HMV86858.1 pitrilysin family protein [Blastocatellia bacterium]HMZ18826.1 pitrilysin family protein [Blastocatellia bacterium]HNG29868.1 pitrilysin family protein [Blastocatellia bacterium]
MRIKTLSTTLMQRLGVVALLLLWSTFSPVMAQAPAVAPANAHDSTAEFTTANGLKTIHREVKANEVVAVQIYFRGGARNITEKNAGIESLMFEVTQQGTKSFSKSVINRELAKTGTIIDSGGGYDFSVMAMRCVRKNFDRSWELLTDMILNPLFDEKELALVKDQTINGLRQQNDSPESSIAILSSKLLYNSHPYFNSPSGTVESVSSLTAADLKAHHAKILETSRMLVVVVGSIPQAELKQKIETSFGKLAKGDFKNEMVPAFAKASTPEFELVNRPVATNYIRGTFAAPPLDSPDYPAFSVAVDILGQLFFQEVRVRRNLSYGADATLLSNRANSAYLSVTTQKPNETIQVMFDQIEFLKRQTIREEGLKAIVSGFLTKYYTKLETNDAQAARLAEYELLGGNWRRLQSWIDEVNKVKPEDINRVSRAYLKNFHFAVAGNPKEFDKDLFLSR